MALSSGQKRSLCRLISAPLPPPPVPDKAVLLWPSLTLSTTPPFPPQVLESSGCSRATCVHHSQQENSMAELWHGLTEPWAQAWRHSAGDLQEEERSAERKPNGD